MNHCLAREELNEIIDHIVYGKNMVHEGLKTLFDLAYDWQDQLICLSYLLSMVLEGRSKDGKACWEAIDVVYRLPEELCLFIQEFDMDFVGYMLGHTRNKNLSLEDDLTELQTRFSEHLYDRAIRY